MKLSDEPDFWPGLRAGARKSRRLLGEKGSAIFELAIVLPLLSMLLVGIIYSGIAFYDYVVLANAVATGARTLSISAGTSSPCTTATTAVTNAAYSLNSSNLSITIGFPSPPDTASDSCSNLAEGHEVLVSAVYPCNLTIPFLGTNLCPIAKGATIIPASETGGAAVTCPYTSCISATTIRDIE